MALVELVVCTEVGVEVVERTELLEWGVVVAAGRLVMTSLVEQTVEGVLEELASGKIQNYH